MKTQKEESQVTKPATIDTIAPEVLAAEILKIAEAMKALDASRLKRRAIVTLIHEESKVPRRTIEIILNNLTELQSLWLK